ncbi:MAG: histidine kinase N-terminal domain-containing protein [Kocuria sp.]|uniref:sensor histidine kinase n=1 Tax=Kocuria TaxID=57493 RepID=UPI0011A2A1B6|nr:MULTISPECIES: PAS domain-containing sensor histidine kinase [Kocuria]MBS6030223.1 histidine kinase N-terminal domain-containing protein [Kocuria rhizophila]MDO4256041.1 histidine kinase N-terminal domain-containing protein [Kocuria sp.]
MSFTDPLRSVPDFDAGDAEWLHLLVGDWQMVADLGVGDLLLCFPRSVVSAAQSPTGRPIPTEDSDFLVLAHARPTTGPTAYQKDMVGETVGGDVARTLRRAWIDQRIEKVGPSEWSSLAPRSVTLVPLVRNNRTIAVVSLTAEPHHDRLPSHMELVYRQSASDLLRMANEGTWPDFAVRIDSRRGAPRVGDGLIRLDTDGVVEFCSPNGLSTFRRLGLQGDLTGQNLLHAARQLNLNAPGVDETLAPVLAGTMPWRAELSAVKASASLRAFPLRRGTERAGALVLCRDVTELRRRDLQLVSKDATIREIHHRVKNNLQTVSALLRLQSRRMNSAEGRNGLQQAMRRVSSIARVHESLSHEISEDVDFDDLIRHQVKLAVETASASQHVRTEVHGEFGRLPSKSATSVALVVNELVANAVEHGLRDSNGTVELSVAHLQDEVDAAGTTHRVLEITIDDDGRGMGDTVIEESGVNAYRPPAEGEGLGMQIVRTLVASELGGGIRWQPGETGGTRVVITARFPQQTSGRR